MGFSTEYEYIVVGDSQTPYIDNKTALARRIDTEGGESSLWLGGQSVIWLCNALKKFDVCPKVKVVVTSMGTNGSFGKVFKKESVPLLFQLLREKFPNAHILVVMGSWGWKGLAGFTEAQVRAYYKKWEDLGGILVEPPIGCASKDCNPHGQHPVYTKIGAEIDRLIGTLVGKTPPINEELNKNVKSIPENGKVEEKKEVKKEVKKTPPPDEKAGPNPFKKKGQVKVFQKWVENVKGDKAILGSFGSDGDWGLNTSKAWDKYGAEYKKVRQKLINDIYCNLDEKNNVKSGFGTNGLGSGLPDYTGRSWTKFTEDLVVDDGEINLAKKDCKKEDGKEDYKDENQKQESGNVKPEKIPKVLQSQLTTFFEPQIRPLPITIKFDGNVASQSELELIKKKLGFEPFIWLKGVSISKEDIINFSLYHEEMVPSIKISFYDSWGIMQEEGFPNDDTIISIFINSRSKNLRSINMDFKILSFKNLGKNRYSIRGVANIPNIYLRKFQSFREKTSHVTLQDVSKESQLGFLSNVNSSSDIMTWINPGYRVSQFIKNTIMKSYISDISFQYCYIDYYYNLCYCDLNLELSRDNGNDVMVETFNWNLIRPQEDSPEEEIIPAFLSTDLGLKNSNSFIQSYIILNKSTQISLSEAYRTRSKFYNSINKELLVFDIDSQTSDGAKTLILKGNPQDDGTFYKDNLGSIWLGKLDPWNEGKGNAHINFNYAEPQNMRNYIDLNKISCVLILPNVNMNLYIFQKISILFQTSKETPATQTFFYKRISGNWLITEIKFIYNKRGAYQKVVAVKRELTLMPDEQETDFQIRNSIIKKKTEKFEENHNPLTPAEQEELDRIEEQKRAKKQKEREVQKEKQKEVEVENKEVKREEKKEEVKKGETPTRQQILSGEKVEVYAPEDKKPLVVKFDPSVRNNPPLSMPTNLSAAKQKTLDFYAKVLERMGIEATNGNILFFVAWRAFEAGVAKYNPFNTTFKKPGATEYNGVGVRNYLTEEDGISATVETMNKGIYKNLMDKLRKVKNLEDAFNVAVSESDGPSDQSLYVWSQGFYDRRIRDCQEFNKPGHGNLSAKTIKNIKNKALGLCPVPKDIKNSYVAKKLAEYANRKIYLPSQLSAKDIKEAGGY